MKDPKRSKIATGSRVWTRCGTDEIIIICAALLFFALVFRIPAGPGEARAALEVIFEIAIFLSLVGVLWQENKYIAAFLALTTFSMFWPHYGPMSYYAGRAVFNGCLWYYFLVKFLTKSNLPKLYNVICICAMFHVFMLIVQKLNIRSALQTPVPVGLMTNPGETAALLAYCLPAFLRGRWTWLIPIPVVGLVIAGPILGMISAGVGVSFYLIIRYRAYWVLAAFPVLVILHCIFVDMPTMNLRWVVWRMTFKAWLETPILGAGIGHWRAAFMNMRVDGLAWHTAHNEYIQTLFELGIGFAAILALWLVDIFRRARKQWAAKRNNAYKFLFKVFEKESVAKNIKIIDTSIFPLTALLIIMVQSGAHFVFHIAPTAMLAVTWFAILEYELRYFEIQKKEGGKKQGRKKRKIEFP